MGPPVAEPVGPPAGSAAPDPRRPVPDVPPPPPGVWPLAAPPSLPPGARAAGTAARVGLPAPPVALGLSVAAIVAYLGTQLVVQLVVGLVLFGAGLLDPLLLDQEQGGTALLVLVVVSQVVGLLAALGLLRRRGVPLAPIVGPSRPVGRHVGIGVGLGLVAIVGSTLLVSLLIALTGSEATPQQVLTDGIVDTPERLVLAVLAAVVMAPIAEELLFRGLLHRALRHRLRIVPATLLSSVIFAVVHVDVAASQPLALVGLTFVGVVLAIAHERTGSLLVPVVMHATHNAVTIAAVVVSSRLDTELLGGMLG